MVNNVIGENPPGGVFHITTHTSNWLWTVFAIMLLSLLFSIIWTGLRRSRNKTLHQIPNIVLTVSTIAYFSMASDLGWTLILTFGGTRQVWYVRYIQWFINAPLILLGALVFTGLTVPDILTTLFFSWAVVVSGLCGSLVTSSYKWGYYAFGVASLFYIWFRLFVHSSRYPFRCSTSTRTGFWGLASYIASIWTIYPICWGLSEGSNTISPTSEMVFYGILDILAGPLYLLFFMQLVDSLEYNELGAASLSAADRGIAERKAPEPAPSGAPERAPANAPEDATNNPGTYTV